MSPRNLLTSLATLPTPAVMSISATAPAPTVATTRPEHWRDFSSNWTFPTPLNATFIENYYVHQMMYPVNITEDPTSLRHVTDIINEALQNVTLPKDGEFGNEHMLLRVGDVIEPDWAIKNTGNEQEAAGEPHNSAEQNNQKTVTTNCVICSLGVEGGSVLTACSNYTNESYISYLYNDSSLIQPGAPLTIGDLSSTINLPDRSVGLCILTLSYSEGTWGDDHSVPFAITQQAREDPLAPHWRFNLAHPTGIPDPSISVPTPRTEPAGVGDADPANAPNDDGPNVGMIVGVVIGVLGGTALIAVIGWMLWRKRRGPKGTTKSVDTPPNEREDDAASVELQPVHRGGVERRLSRDEDGEVPPAYHEAVAAGAVAGQGREGEVRFG